MSLILTVGNDIIPEADVLDIPESMENLYIDAGSLIAGTMDIVLTNASGTYDDSVSGNIFYSDSWYDKEVKIYNTDLNRYFWKSKLKNLVRSYEEGKITLQTENIISDLKKTCIYSSTTNKTPAAIIYDLITITAEVNSDYIYFRGFQKAINKQTQGGLFLNVNYVASDGQDCQSIITELCKICQCSLYSKDNMIHMYQWEEWTPALTTVIDDSVIIGNKVSEQYEQKFVYNAYSIAYDNAGTVAFAEGSDIASIALFGKKTLTIPDKKLDSTASTAYKILCKTKAAADYAGTLAISRYKHLTKTIGFDIIDDADIQIGDETLLTFNNYMKEPVLIESRKYDINNKKYSLNCRFLNIPFNYYERDLTPPDGVEIVLAIALNKAIYLKWTMPTQADLFAYKIYFTTTRGEWMTEQCLQGMSPIEIKIDDIDMTKDGYCFYCLRQLQTGTYSIKIKAIDSNYNESIDSNVVSVFVFNNLTFENLYFCDGDLFINGIYPALTNTRNGTVPDEFVLYDEDYYDNFYYQPSRYYYSMIFEAKILFSSILLRSNSSEIMIQFREYSGGSFSAWSGLYSFTGSLSFNLNIKAFQMRIIFPDNYNPDLNLYIKDIIEV